MKPNELKKLEQKVYVYEAKLNCALEELANTVTLILGYEVVAELCSGGSEIEFRTICDDGRPDSDCCIRMEDVISLLK